MLSDILIAFALVFVVEGFLYALFPDAMKRMMEQALTIPASTLRTAGLGAATVGVFLIWLLRG